MQTEIIRPGHNDDGLRSVRVTNLVLIVSFAPKGGEPESRAPLMWPLAPRNNTVIIFGRMIG